MQEQTYELHPPVQYPVPETHESTAVAEGWQIPDVEPTYRNMRMIGIVLGVLAGLIVYFIFPDTVPRPVVDALAEKDLTTSPHALKATAATAVLMAVWWMTEALPLAATALVPLVAFPLLGISEFKAAASSYASGTIFLFFGGFVLALAMQRWNLHRRIALNVVLLVGTKPKRLVLGFMVASGFLSMWVSNTATAVMMLPIGISILQTVGHFQTEHGERSKFGIALVLGIAYACSTASLSTLIGTPPNALLRGYLEANHGITIGFGQWMLFGVPVAWSLTILAWFLLTHILYKPEIDDIPGGKELVREELREMGPMSAQEKKVGIIFLIAALSWIFIPTLFKDSGITDELIAMCVAIALYIIPARTRAGIALMDWESTKDIPWDVLLLFGGGLSLSAAFGNTGLSLWIGEQARGLQGMPMWLIITLCCCLVLALTEMTSNTATAAAFLPIMGGIAVGMGIDVMALTVPIAMSATTAFMLPVATPPNAIAYGTGFIEIKHMVKVGIWLNIIAIPILVISTMTLGKWVLGINL